MSHQRKQLHCAVETSDSSDIDETEDSIFSKYSSTPPSNRNAKSLKKRDRALSSFPHYSKSIDEFQLSQIEAKINWPPKLKHQRKQFSIQRDCDRKLKKLPISMTKASTIEISFSSGDDEEVTLKPSANHDLKVESRNRFMSLCSRLVKLPRKIRARRIGYFQNNQLNEQNRSDLQGFFIELTQTRGPAQSNTEPCSFKSDEEIVWQSELKDLLWLELQAWISQRSPQDQDQYLFTRRQEIPGVLNRIMEYRFQPAVNEEGSEYEECTKCTSAFCQNCALNQSKALHEICSLLEELDQIEELYPSGRALSADYPLHGSPEFNNRIKAMCLWYNVSCLLQLKIDIIGQMLISLGSSGPWPTWPAWPPASHGKDNTETASAVYENQNSTTEEPEKEFQSIASPKKKPLKREPSRVQFFFENNLNESGNRHRLEDSPTESFKSEYSGTDLAEADIDLNHGYVTEVSTLPNIDPLKPETNFKEKIETQSDGLENLIGSDFSYRNYIEKALKTKGLRKMLQWIFIIHRVNMLRAKEALQKPGSSQRSSSPELTPEYEPWEGNLVDDLELKELQRYGTWSPEYLELNLPQYRTLFLFLCRIPLDVIRESLHIRLEQKPAEPSSLSIRQLMQEFKEGIRVGVICKKKYRRDVGEVYPESEDVPQNALNKDYDNTLELTLNVYLDYLKRWVCMGSPSNVVLKNVLEQEWKFVLSVCSEISNGEMLAANAFCRIASSVTSSTGRFIREGIQTAVNAFHPESSGSENDERTEKEMALSILRRIQCTLQEGRQLCIKAVAITKMIRKDLEVAAEFDVRMPIADLVQRLRNSGHVRVIMSNSRNYMAFVPHHLKNRDEHLRFLLNSFSHSEAHTNNFHSCGQDLKKEDDENNDYMVLLKAESEEEFSENIWDGGTIVLNNLKNEELFSSLGFSGTFLLIVFNALELSSKRHDLINLLGPGLNFKNDGRPSNFIVHEALIEVKNETVRLSRTIISAIQDIEEHGNICKLDPSENITLVSRWKEVVRQCFKLGFEFHKDALRLMSGKTSINLALTVVELAKKWMTFAIEHCERGRGVKPKWAAQGIDFLITVCEPEVTECLSDAEFLQLKELMRKCVDHVIGSPEPSPSSPILMIPPLKSRSSSPALRRLSKISVGSLSSFNMSSPVSTPVITKRLSLQEDSSLHQSFSSNHSQESLTFPSNQCNDIMSRRERTQQSIDYIEKNRDQNLANRNLIGRVSRNKGTKWQIRLKSVQFSWQRGVKIGQGRFGKVYVAVNNRTGELMAMKEISLQPNDHKAMRSVADELRILEGIHHKHLVCYYGVEVHREEMIIFMEFCPEGTLEQLVSSTENGLPEELIRRFTRQLLEAVSILHHHGIVHRDIKGANIFLTEGGNCLKLGDFGCSAQIKAHTTMAGELQGLVGTQAFMAPEVFMHTMAEGHGRAADIWSVGCVVIEMSTGKRPWYELDSNYAIMFKVGMGEVPPIPSTLSEEGQTFLGHLLQHDPRSRETASVLLEHNFLKVFLEDEI